MRLRARRGDEGTGAAGGARVPPETAHARMAAWSGVLFALLFTTGLILVRQAPELAAPDADYVGFYSSGWGGVLVVLGLYIVPFAGIAFLWHMIAIRTLLQALRSRSLAEIPHRLHLAVGMVFVVMMFGGSAAVGAVALLTTFSAAPLPPPDVARALSSVGYAMVFVFGVFAAAVYMITTAGLAGSAGLFPRWLAVLSHVVAVFLLISVTFLPAILLVFPAWVLLASIVLLVRPPKGTP